MEPSKTHGTSPQQEPTQPVGGCPAALRAADLLLGGREGANTHVGPRVATVSSDPKAFTRLDAYEMLMELAKRRSMKCRPPDLSLDERTLTLLNAMGLPKELVNEKGPRRIVAAFTSKCECFYIACSRNMSHFFKKHSKWLNEDFKQQFYQVLNPEQLAAFTDAPVSVSDVDPISGDAFHQSSSISSSETYHTRSHGPVSSPEPPTPKPRPRKSYEQLSAKQQRRQRKRLEEILKDEPQAKLIKVFATIVKVNGERLSKAAAKDLEYVIHACLESPNRLSEIVAAIKKEPPRPFTPEEALDLSIKLNLSARSYTSMQQDWKERGFDALPPYYKVLEAKKRRFCNDSGQRASISTSLEANEDRSSDQNIELENDSDSYDSCWNLVLTNEMELFCSSSDSGKASPDSKSPSPECGQTPNIS